MIFVDLVFEALSRDRSTHAVLLVWQQCYRQATLGRAGLTNGDIAKSLGLSRVRVRQCLKVLGKLGLVLAERRHANTGFDVILVAQTPDQVVTDLLHNIQAGDVTIDVEKTEVWDTMFGESVDLTPRLTDARPSVTLPGVWFLENESSALYSNINNIDIVTKDLVTKSDLVTKTDIVTKSDSNKSSNNSNLQLSFSDPQLSLSSGQADDGLMPKKVRRKKAPKSQTDPTPRKKARKKAPKPPKDPTPKVTWLTPFTDPWLARFGKANFGRFARDLDPLVKEHGPDEVLARWRRYLDDTPDKFCSLSRFIEIFKTLGTLTNTPQLLGCPSRKVRLREL